MPPPLPLVFHFDWIKIGEGILTTGGGSLVLYLLGRSAQKWRQKVDTRTGDQKAIDQLMGRVSTLETQMTVANTKIEDLRTEKMELQVQIISLREQIALLEVKKAEFESREAIFNAQIAELQGLLAKKSSELLCAVTKLAALEANGTN